MKREVDIEGLLALERTREGVRRAIVLLAGNPDPAAVARARVLLGHLSDALTHALKLPGRRRSRAA